MEHLTEFMMNHWLLWTAFVILLFMIFGYESFEQKKKANELSPQAVVDLMNHQDAVVLDLRDKESYKKSHIINAIQTSADALENDALNKYKEKPLILVCAKGLQSPSIATKLKLKGLTGVNVLKGGMENWIAAGLPTVNPKKKG